MRYIFVLLPALILSAQMVPAQTTAPAKKAAPVAAKAAAVPAGNFKVSGSPAAPITIEIYTDYECPACRELYLNTLPSLQKEFIDTGKVRLVHRDYPLPQHQYSPQATLYANAAGEIGKYEIVAQQIFQTQPEWSQSGNVDAQVAKVLSPADMAKVREIVKNDKNSIQENVSKDVAMGNVDRLSQTPTLVIVANGRREPIAGAMPYPILKSYLNKKLGQ